MLFPSGTYSFESEVFMGTKWCLGGWGGGRGQKACITHEVFSTLLLKRRRGFDDLHMTKEKTVAIQVLIIH